MNIVKNKIFIYLSSRYLTYGLQFVLSLIIASRLGPYYLGVYGVVQLILSYFGQLNFGIPHSLNVIYVQHKDSEELQNAYAINSYLIYTYFNVLVIAISVIVYSLGYCKWGEYDISRYFFWIVSIAVLTYYNNIINTIIRCRNRVNVLSILGTLPVFLNLSVVFLFKEEQLVLALTVANSISCLFTFLIGIYIGAFPSFDKNQISKFFQSRLINKGFYLFLYNSCFYFILIGVRTLISSNYSVEEFGFFTFSYTIANAVMLLLDSMSFIIFPKTIDLLSGSEKEGKMAILGKLRVGYISTSHLMIYTAMILFPKLLVFFPKYQDALPSLNLIALAVLMNTNSYGYNSLLIAQNKEKVAALISTIALIISLIVGWWLVYVINVSYSSVSLSVLIAYMVFSFLATYYANRFLLDDSDIIHTIKNFFPYRFLIPYIVALVISLFEFESVVFIPLLLFVILNYKDIYYLVSIIKKLIKNPNVIDV